MKTITLVLLSLISASAMADDSAVQGVGTGGISECVNLSVAAAMNIARQNNFLENGVPTVEVSPHRAPGCNPINAMQLAVTINGHPICVVAQVSVANPALGGNQPLTGCMWADGSLPRKLNGY